jgi:hypothetical protein
MLHNADLYMCPWRRTLAELLQSGTPVVVTMYCEFEGAAMERLFKWPEIEFAERKSVASQQPVFFLFFFPVKTTAL